MKEWQNPEVRELGVESTEKGPDNNHVLDATTYEASTKDARRHGKGKRGT